MDIIKTVILLVLSFLAGSIPFGIIVAKAKGVDLRKVGSGNIGATNVLRSMGKWPAAVTLLGDIMKGTFAVALGRYFGADTLYEGLFGVAAVLGHNFSVFLKFRGGKGVATSLGVLLVYAPLTACITVILWLIVSVFTKYSSLGAIVSFGLLPLNIFLLEMDNKEKMFTGVVITLLILIRHTDNMKRLIKGTERKIGQRE
jgi:acyl phosphate:glycerol-3-phosphate acyltransferase